MKRCISCGAPSDFIVCLLCYPDFNELDDSKCPVCGKPSNKIWFPYCDHDCKWEDEENSVVNSVVESKNVR